MARIYTISGLEEQSGLSRSTIHYYGRKGLLSAPVKKRKTRAYYTERHLQELQRIQSLKAAGWPLDMIREELWGQRQQHRDLESGGYHKKILPAEGSEAREKLINVASKIFARKGYYHTKVEDICLAAGLSRTTFYFYFKDKRSFFFECMDNVILEMMQMVRSEWSGETDPVERMRLRARAIVKYYRPFSELVAISRNLLNAEEPEIAEKAREIYRLLAAPLISDLEQAMEKKVARIEGPELAAYILLGAVDALINRLGMDNRYDPGRAAELLIDIFSYGMLCRGDKRKQTGDRPDNCN